MLFPTFTFAAFFAVVLPVAWALKRWPVPWKLFLLGASYWFYAAWDARFVLLLVGMTLGNAAAAAEALGGELCAQVHRQLDDRVGNLGRGGAGLARSGLERRGALCAVSGDQSGDPRPRDAVGSGDFGVGPPLGDDSGDHQAGPRHPPPWNTGAMFLCLAT